MKSFLTFPLLSVALQLIGASTRTFAAPDGTNPFVIGDEDFYVYEKPTAPAYAYAPSQCEYDTVKEMCENDDQFVEFCKALVKAKYLRGTENLLNSNKNFTIFAATDEGWGNYYLKVLESTVVGSTALEETLEYGIIAGAQLETIDLMVNKKIDIISTKPGAKPKIISKTDVLLEEYAYIKGKANTGDYIPKFITPINANPDLVCNANIFSMNGAILVKKPTVNIKA
mmetsp:Transcript_25351/g.53991  ORF Transcript_25351/g.53991 Transcript_25351/m.53991 type:complete len:227 (+) Transcript_25351:150-830(+)